MKNVQCFDRLLPAVNCLRFKSCLVENDSKCVRNYLFIVGNDRYEATLRRDQIVHEAFHAALPHDLTVGHRLTFKTPSGDEVFADNFLADIEDRFATSELSLDHVVPTCRGGDTSWENLVCACVRCNVRKGGRTPQEANIRLIKKPVRPKRSPLLTIKLGNPKYASWKTFLDSAYWSVDLK